MAAIWERSITITQNATATFSWGYCYLPETVPPTPNTGSVPYDYAGTVVSFAIHETSDPTSPLLCQLSSATGGIVFAGTEVVDGFNSGVLAWSIPPTVTVTFTPGTYWFDLLWTFTTGEQFYLAEGPCIVQGTAGR